MEPAEKQEETGFRVTEISTTDLLGMGAPWNPRSISRHDLEALRRSLRFFGAVEPIVVNRRSGNIVGGHQRVKAAEAEGMESLPVVYVNLDDPGEKQLNLALNRISGDFDPDKLAVVFADLDAVGADLGLTGFTDAEIEDLCRPPGDPTAGETDPDAVPDPPDDPATQPGDLVVLGRHRLLCGDSANPDDVARLLEGQRIHLVNTDPRRARNRSLGGLSGTGFVPFPRSRDRFHSLGPASGIGFGRGCGMPGRVWPAMPHGVLRPKQLKGNDLGSIDHSLRPL